MRFVSRTICVLLLYPVSILSCSKNETPPPKNSADDIQKAEVQQAVKRLAAQTGARTDWVASITGNTNSEWSDDDLYLSDTPWYTIDLQRTIVGDRPIVFKATLVDVIEHHGGFRVVLAYPGDYDETITFNLSGTSRIVDTLLEGRPTDIDVCVVCAKVKSVTRPAYLLTTDENDSGDFRGQIAIDSMRLPFHADGEIVAVDVIRYPNTGQETQGRVLR